MKIGKLTDRINSSLSEQYPSFKATQHINASKINGYKKMGLITPEVKKNKNKSFFEFEEYHFSLILEAYENILFQGMRTREAFNRAKAEISSPSLF